MSPLLLQLHITVPPYFLCPISLQLMLDPVTLSSGHTFDRPSIETWLHQRHPSCPVTRQILPVDEEPIPNHALRRMIQNWCVENRSLGIERISTPRQPANLSEIRQLIHGLRQRNVDYLDTLQRLSRIAQDRPRTRTHMLQAGLLSELAGFLVESVTCPSCINDSCFGTPTCWMLDKSAETLRLLALLSETEGSTAFWEPSLEQISSVAQFVAKAGKGGNCRQNAALILSSCEMSEDMKRKVGAMEGFMTGVLQLVTEELSLKATTTGLILLVEVCKSTRNRILASEAGVVGGLLGMLASGADKMTTEVVMKVVEEVCRCAEGRAAMCEDEARGIKEVVKALNGVSEKATTHAVEVLWVVVRKEPGMQARKRALQEGVMVKLMTAAQTTAVSSHTRSRAGSLLRELMQV